eukprot:scaffold145641_cov32-Tisochrysis_lutea.AAC.4
MAWLPHPKKQKRNAAGSAWHARKMAWLPHPKKCKRSRLMVTSPRDIEAKRQGLEERNPSFLLM